MDPNQQKVCGKDGETYANLCVWKCATNNEGNYYAKPACYTECPCEGGDGGEGGGGGCDF